jgi:hypothetical protein
VLCWGEIIEEHNDKLCAEHRKVLWLEDCDDALGEFGCIVAEQSLDLVASKGFHIDERSRQAISVKRKWIAGTATQEELHAARSAADAARSAAESAQNDVLESLLFALNKESS